MFVFVHYIAGVYLDFHCKVVTLGNRKKVPNSNHLCFICYGSSGQASRPICFGGDLSCYFRNPDQLNNNFK